MNKILIAEDEAPIANLIRTALERLWLPLYLGGRRRCRSGPVEKEPFDLVLLDIMRPKADGYEVLEYGKSLDVPVIFLTAKVEHTGSGKGAAAGRGGLRHQTF